MSFFDTSQMIAQEFIQSVVFVDDRASFDIRQGTEEDTKFIKEPNSANAVELSDDESTDNEDPFEKITENFDAKKIVDAFASLGIITSIIKPDKPEDQQVVSNVVNLSKVVDVIVLDIDINKDNGAIALDIFTKIIKEEPRLKLIVFYSGAGAPSISDFAIEIKQLVLAKSGIELKKYVYQIEKTRISIIPKEGVGSKGVKFEELPKRIIKEFTEITHGIIPNATLYALSLLKKNTHQILNNLNSEMDAPFLAHRAWLEQPSDSESFIKELILSEFESAIYSNMEINKQSGLENISNYIEYKSRGNNFKIFIDDNHEREIDFNKIKYILSKGLADKGNRKEINIGANKNQNIGENTYKNFTKTFCFNSEDYHILDNKFSILTSLNNYLKPSNNNVSLHLGTVLKKDVFPEYYLCLQPKCDSVRIEEKQKFLFLKLIMDENKFDLIVYDEMNNHVKLKVSNNVHDILTYEFASTELGVVQSSFIGGKLCFRSTDSIIFNWIAQLKDSFAQSIVHNYSSKLSRVGLDHYEWLRRQA